MATTLTRLEAGGLSTESDSPNTLRAFVYDADGTDGEVALEEIHVDQLGDGQLAWVDLASGDDEALEAVARCFDLCEQTVARIKAPPTRPRLERFERYIHVNVQAVKTAPDGFDPVATDCVAGASWLVTVHHPSLDVVKRFHGPFRSQTELGALDGPAFLANLLDVLLNDYFRVVEELEVSVDELDERLLRDEVDQDDLLRDLIRLRRRITMLRTTLGPHRDVLALVAQPEFQSVATVEPRDHYRRLYDRLERAIESVENAREMVVGSFEVFMTQTAQRTNEVMKVLTLVSVLLLPAGVIAAIMGMNVRTGLYASRYAFAVSIGLMVAMALVTLLVAKRRRWI